jgi:hypothetical protein
MADKEFTMTMKKIAAGTVMAGALGLATLGIGSGLAHADPKLPPPPVPGDGVWSPGQPPGHNPFGPPGQVKKEPFIGDVPGVPNPFYGVPPGHWDDPGYFGLPVTWLPPGIPGVTEPLRLLWNPNANAWGVWVNDDLFIPYPVS